MEISCERERQIPQSARNTARGTLVSARACRTGNQKSVTLNHVRQLAGNHNLIPVLCLCLSRGHGKRTPEGRYCWPLAVLSFSSSSATCSAVEAATGCQTAHQVPTQVSINVQALRGQLALEEALHVSYCTSVRVLVDKRLHQLQLSIPNRALRRWPAPTRRSAGGSLLTSLGSHEGVQGSRRVVNLGAQAGGVGLLTDVVPAPSQRTCVLASGVTHRHPRRTPDHAASHGRINVTWCLIAVSMERSSRPNLCVCQVLIVEQ